MPASYGSVPFEEQIEFFKRKLNIPTLSWVDIYSAEHDYAFMVAGASRDAIVSDFREAVERAIVDGGTLEEFRKDFDEIVARHGWDYNGGRDWRSRTIYETNLFSSYNAGRYEQLVESKEALPYWEYNHSDAVADPRPEHLNWDGLILSADDKFWDTHFPINAWGCQCSVTGVSEFDLEAMGKTGPDTAPKIEWVEREIGKRSPDGPITVRVPAGIDPGFEHAPGKSRLGSAVPPFRGSDSSSFAEVNNAQFASDELPMPQSVAAVKVLLDTLTEEDYVKAFLGELGATLDAPRMFKDVTGERIAVGKELFENRLTGELNVTDNFYGWLIKLLALAIKQPDEIWVRIDYSAEQRAAVIRRSYIARFDVENIGLTAVTFQLSRTGWFGKISYSDTGLKKLRTGKRVYQRATE